MFILVPLMLILASVIGISVIVFRKMPYLNKLTPETHVSAHSGAGKIGLDFMNDLLPEFSGVFQSLKLREYGNVWLLELEKFLRRLRLFSLKIDRVSESWIKKIRNGNSSGTTVSPLAEKAEEASVIKPQPVPKMTLEEMKREEQRLIIAIAKSPKDYQLFESLGDLYVKMKSFSDAKESFEAAIELNSQNEDLQKKLSQVLKKLVI